MELHVRAAGTGSAGTILFVHGFPFDGRVWERQMEAVPDGWLGLAPDLRGFGRSPLGADELPRGRKTGAGVALPDEPVLTMDAAAADLERVILDRADGPVVVCGLSMGGYVTFALLRRRPDLVAGLVLMDTRAGPDSDETRENRRRTAATARESGARPIATAMLPSLLAPATRERDRAVAELLTDMMKATAPRTLTAALAGMAGRADSTGDLPSINVPTLVVVGELDGITPPDEARAMADAIPDARLEIIPGAAHLPCLEDPGRTNAAIAELLSRL